MPAPSLEFESKTGKLNKAVTLLVVDDDTCARQSLVAMQIKVGRIAPDFETEDVDGTPFKLSDYRGKVVVLDFWGFW